VLAGREEAGMAIAGDVTWFGGSAGAVPSRTAVRGMRLYFIALAPLGIGALIFGIENRIAPTGAFLFAPPVDLVPPLTAPAWFGAFAVHQQDPVFVACGGTESLDQFKALYWWEWLRQASLVALAGAVAIGLAAALLRYRFALRWFVGPSLAVLGYFLAGALFDAAAANVETLIRYNVGQYRHALGLTFASIAIALTLAIGLGPASTLLRAPRGLAWAGVILATLSVATGALFSARNAAAVWPSFPGYEGAVLPPFDRFTGYAPAWLNLTFNPYVIQLEHRLVALVLWGVLLGALFIAVQRKAPAWGAISVLFLVVTAQTASGIAALVRAAPAVPALVHEVGAVVVLAGFFYLLFPAQRDLGTSVTANCH
jgi:cytochrome c oxidase assembly protein subunit 15